MRAAIVLFLIAFLSFPCGVAQAQGFSGGLSRQAYELFLEKSATSVETAWMHQINLTIYKQLMEGYSFRMVTPLNTAYLQLPDMSVKTTDKKWIYSQINFQDVFSAKEKAILLHHEAPLTNLGKIAYIFDRSESLFAHFKTKTSLSGHDTDAFETHQKRLFNLFTSLDVYYKKRIPDLFASSLFPEEEIKNMIFSSTVQPAAYAFHPKEFETFAALPDLEAQQVWVAENKQVAIDTLYRLQTRNAAQLQAADYSMYYKAKVRLDYLRTLEQVLNKADHKRQSLVMRRKQMIQGLDSPVTDAEHLGFLQFQADVHPTQEILSRLQTQFSLYARYASAEALEAPYEIALKGDYFAPELLGEEEGARLRRLSPQDSYQELTPKLANLENQMQAMRSLTPDGVSFYKKYYRLFAEAQIYKTLLAKARAFEHFQ